MDREITSCGESASWVNQQRAERERRHCNVIISVWSRAKLTICSTIKQEAGTRL